MASTARQLSARTLNPHHNEMVLKYLRFAIMHRKQQVKDITGVFEECKDTRLAEGDSFTSDEVALLLDNLRDTLKADMYRNLQLLSNSNGVLLKQLFTQAEDNVLNLTIDTSILEDELLLSMVQKLEEVAESPQQAKPIDVASSSSTMMPSKLPTLHDEKRAEELLVNNAALKKRQLELEEEVAKLKQESKSRELALKQQIADLSAQVQEKDAEGATSSHSTEATEELSALHRRMRQLEGEVQSKAGEVEALSQQLTARLDQAPQFRSLKELLQKNNAKLKLYHERLIDMGWKDDDDDT